MSGALSADDRPGWDVAGAAVSDAPTAEDHRRIRHARRRARARRREIDAARDAALFAAFRAELGTSVRSASPVLIAMLGIEGLSLDDAVETLRPLHDWPSRPWLSGSGHVSSAAAHYLRHAVATGRRRSDGGSPGQITRPPLVGRRFDRADGGELTLRVVDHSLELRAVVGGVTVETLFGEMVVELGSELPATVFAACVGRLLEDVVDHGAWRGSGWRIAAVAKASYPISPKLIVVTGAVTYAMPWARQASRA